MAAGLVAVGVEVSVVDMGVDLVDAGVEVSVVDGVVAGVDDMEDGAAKTVGA